jgi:hypothetical protein
MSSLHAVLGSKNGLHLATLMCLLTTSVSTWATSAWAQESGSGELRAGAEVFIDQIKLLVGTAETISSNDAFIPTDLRASRNGAYIRLVTGRVTGSLPAQLSLFVNGERRARTKVAANGSYVFDLPVESTASGPISRAALEEAAQTSADTAALLSFDNSVIPGSFSVMVTGDGVVSPGLATQVLATDTTLDALEVTNGLTFPQDPILDLSE